MEVTNRNDYRIGLRQNIYFLHFTNTLYDGGYNSVSTVRAILCCIRFFAGHVTWSIAYDIAMQGRIWV